MNFNKVSTKGISKLKFPKASKTSGINTSEISRQVSKAHSRSRPYLAEGQSVFQKHTCPPVSNPPIDKYEFQDCEQKIKDGKVNSHPDQLKLTTALLETYGYPYKKYRVKTEDDYILTVYRITGSPKLELHKAHKTPVYVNHGFGGASDWWFLPPPEKNMVFMMVNDGYDVWLGNARGSTYSMEHDTLDPKRNLSYWDFSFHEMGIFDVPAVTNTILQETAHKDILYVGYSMGATQALICLTELPEMNGKIRAAYFLAPVAYMGHASCGFRSLAPIFENERAYQALNTAFKGTLLSNADLLKLFRVCGADICVPSAAKCGLCDNAYYAMGGANPLQLNKTVLPLMYDKFPNSVSIKTIAHFSQLVVSCRFQQFEYTPATNLKLYGTLRPPVYDLKKVSSPIYVYHGEQDTFGIPMDVLDTFRRLKSGVLKKVTLVDDELFTHTDFAAAKEVDKLVFKPLLSDMRTYIDVT